MDEIERAFNKNFWEVGKVRNFFLEGFLLFALVLSPAGAQERVEVPFVSLGEITVTGTRTPRSLLESPFLISVITAEQIRESGWATLEEALEELPGVILQTSQSYVVSPTIQGFRDNKVLILVDGMPINAKVRNRVDLSLIPIQNVEKIEVVKGPQSSIYGSDAIAGVIHIITKMPQKTEWRMSSRVGTTGQQRHNFSTSLVGGKWSGLFSYERRTSDGVDLHPGDPALDYPDFRKQNYFGKIRYSFAPGHSITYKGEFFTNRSEIFLWNAARQIKTSWFFWDRRSGHQVTYERIHPDGETLRFFGYFAPFYHSFEEIRPPRPAARSDIRDRYVRLEAQYDYPLSDEHLLTFGADRIEDKYTSDRISPRTQDINMNEVYLQGQWKIHRRWETVYGVRFTEHSRFGSEWTPRIGMVNYWTTHFRSKISAGKGFRAPEITEMFQDFLIPTGPTSSIRILGNPNLRPETSRNVQLTLEFGPYKRSFFRLNGFHNRVNGLILFVPRDDPNTPNIEEWRYENIQAGRTHGVEWEYSHRFSHSFSLFAGGVFQDGKNLSQNTDLEFVPDVQGYVRAAFSFGNFSSSVRWTHVGKQKYGISTTEAGAPPAVLPDYTLLDVSFTYPVGNYQIVFGVDNLTGVEREPFGPSQGRHIYVGYDVRW